MLAEKAGQSGKAADIIEKMVEGGLRKFHQEVVLLAQLFVIDGKTRVAEGRGRGRQAGRRAGPAAGFLRFAVGRGHREEAETISRPRWLPSSRSSMNPATGDAG